MQSPPPVHDEYTNHSDTLLLAKILGYKINDGGMCAGIATMGMQAILAEDVDSYEERRFFITNLVSDILEDYEKKYGKEYGLQTKAMHYSAWWLEFFKSLSSTNSPQNKAMLNVALERLAMILEERIQTFSAADKDKWLEMRPNFDGIIINFNPDFYPDFLTTQPHGQNFRVAVPITTPVTLDQEGIHEFDKIAYSFNFDELKYFLEKMKDDMFVITSSSKAIIISGNTTYGGHTITIGYNPKTTEWIFINSNQELLKTKDVNTLSQNIFNIFQHNHHVNLQLDTYGLSSEKDKITQPLQIIQNSLIEDLKLNPNKLHQQDAWNLSFISIDVRYQNTKWIQFVIENLNELQKNNLLIKAIHDNDVVLAKLLLPYLQNSSLYDNVKNQPLLITAIHNGNSEIIKLLLDNKANVNENDFLNSPLLKAILMRNKNIVELLLDYGADPNLVLSHGYTATQVGALNYSKDNSQILPLLMQHGGDVNLKIRDITALGLIKDPADKQTIQNILEDNAKYILTVIKNYIETFPWEINGLFGGKDITLSDGRVIAVPTHVEKQWNIINQAGNDPKQLSYSDALKSVTNIAQTASSNMNRSTSTTKYYGLFTDNDQKKIINNLSPQPDKKKSLKK